MMKFFHKINSQRFILSILLIFAFLISSAQFSYAQKIIEERTPDTTTHISENPNTNTSGTTGTLQNPLKIDSIGKLINTLLDVFAYVAVLLAVGALIWVGFKFILARGNATKTKEAGIWLGYIVIGIAIILGARLIISIVLSTLEATGVVKSDVIQSAYQGLRDQ